MPPHLKSNRQATRIPKSSCLLCLYIPCREGRPHEYLKAPGKNASAPQVEPAGHTNTPKASSANASTGLSSRQAPRIPQSSRHKCLYRTCRTGRPHEYLKVPGTNASTPHVETAGHTNTLKFLSLMPLRPLPRRQAIRIPQSSCLLCLYVPCREGRPKRLPS